MKSKILVTGGAGYIGTHTLVSLSEAGYDFIVYDNFSNSSKIALLKVEKIINKKIEFCEGDIKDSNKLKKLFKKYSFNSVIHFAGLKAVSESVENPIKYYDNNVNGTIRLLEVMKDFNCKQLVFSSSATVYGEHMNMPINESFEVGNTTNPYGASKYMVERILEDFNASDNSFKIAILRYFNPVGAHESGFIGEDPSDIPNNLMPYIAQVAVKKRDFLNVFGNEYSTPDGTGVRDYIHVVDLAQGHVKAIEFLKKKDSLDKPIKVNLGTGKGHSVFDLINTFEKVSKQKINYKIAPKREGDIATCYADVTLAKKLLSWESKKTIEDMCKDTWNWQKKNPNGYEE